MAILAKPRSVRFIQMLRLAVVLFTAAAVFFFLRDSYGGDAVFVVDIPLAALIAVNILSTLWLWQHLRRSGTVEEEQFYLQVFLDVMLMGMVVFYTGASSSTLTLVFLLPVILASAFLYLRGSLFAASLSTIVLATLFYLDVNGWLAGYGPNYLQSALDFMTDEDAPLLLAQSITTILALFATAAISGYLAENQLSIIRELGELTRRLERIRINTSDVLTNLESGLLTVDADGTIIFLNRTAREILQVEETEPEGRNYETVFSGRLEPFGEFVRTILGKSSPLSARNELQLETADGKILPLGLTPTLLRDAHTTRGMVLIFQDLTQAKVTEDKIRRQDRLAAIGELGAGIAHELRNPLASISGSAEVLQSSLSVGAEDRRLLNLIVKESIRINDIVEQFLSYARIQQEDRHRIDLRELVGEVVTLAKNHPSYREGQQISVELDRCPPIMADAAQMKQVFLNLILNGLEATKGSGSISIRMPIEGEELSVGDGLSEIWVQDEGPGVPEDEIDSIFEPFYTNKQGGTGLGLAVVYRIMESNEGRILYAPTSDGTSTFRIYLPKGGK